MPNTPQEALAIATTERLSQLDTVSLLGVPEPWEPLAVALFMKALEKCRRFIPAELRRLVRTNGAEIMGRAAGQELALIAAGLVNSTLRFLAKEVVRECRELDAEDPAAWEQMSVATTYRDFPGRVFRQAPAGCEVPTIEAQMAGFKVREQGAGDGGASAPTQ
ncbi:MAG TPA: hypothetical protein VG269_26705 [Tepidisphaeraceae bacterium]|jgi:hypothetical protein|nr:hypothetical protein [Tepidisphaeraceae bacterium]